MRVLKIEHILTRKAVTSYYLVTVLSGWGPFKKIKTYMSEHYVLFPERPLGWFRLLGPNRTGWVTSMRQNQLNSIVMFHRQGGKVEGIR